MLWLNDKLCSIVIAAFFLETIFCMACAATLDHTHITSPLTLSLKADKECPAEFSACALRAQGGSARADVGPSCQSDGSWVKEMWKWMFFTFHCAKCDKHSKCIKKKTRKFCKHFIFHCESKTFNDIRGLALASSSRRAFWRSCTRDPDSDSATLRSNVFAKVQRSFIDFFLIHRFELYKFWTKTGTSPSRLVAACFVGGEPSAHLFCAETLPKLPQSHYSAEKHTENDTEWNRTVGCKSGQHVPLASKNDQVISKHSHDELVPCVIDSVSLSTAHRHVSAVRVFHCTPANFFHQNIKASFIV